MRKNNILSEFFRYSIVILLLLFIVIPFYLMIVISLKDSKAFSASEFSIPTILYLNNYYTALIEGKMIQSLLNSLIVTGVTVLIHIFVCAGAAYVLVKHEIKLLNVKINVTLTTYFVLGSMVPATAYMLPLFTQMRNLHLINNLISLILINITLNIPLGILMFSGFVNSISNEIEEAAKIDGCSILQCFYKIILPLMKPAVATITILVGLNSWNDFLFPLLFISKESLKTMTVKIFTFTGQYSNNWPVLTAAMLICSIPMIVLYLVRQKDFIKGVASGAVKG